MALNSIHGIISSCMLLTLVVYKCDGFFSCGSIPDKIGDFFFLAQPWPQVNGIGLHKVYETSNFDINCTTNMPDANVSLFIFSTTSNQWLSYKLFPKEVVDPIVKKKQLFSVAKVTSAARQMYRCHAEQRGQKICMFKGVVLVLPPPNLVPVIRPLEKVAKTTVGEYLEVSCEAPGVGSKTESFLKWYKRMPGRDVLVEKDLVKIDGAYFNGSPYDYDRLVFKEAKKEQAGVYVCKRKVIGEKFGTSAEVEIVIQDPTKPIIKLDPPYPEIKVHPDKKDVVTIVCMNVGGSPWPRKEWIGPDGKKIYGCNKYSENCTLTIFISSHAQDHGRYTCIAVSVGGRSSVHVMLNVFVKPDLVKVPSTEVAGYDESVMLICKTNRASPPPTMVWYYQRWSCPTMTCKPSDQEWTNLFDKVSLQPASTVPTNESRLVVPASKMNAYYSCRATNEMGADVYNVTLHRFATPPSILRFAASLASPNENDSYALNCTFSPNVYTSVRWIKDGSSMQEVAGRVAIRTLYIDFFEILAINFERAALNDSGTYTCKGRMKNGTEKSISHAVMVKALERPGIIGLETSRTLNQTNGNAVLLCNASGNPFPLITWKFFGTVIAGVGIVRGLDDCSTRKKGRYFVEGSRRQKLVICDLDYRVHEGLYECKVENKVATKSASTFIRVWSPPKIVRWEEKIQYELDKPVRLYCEAQGNPRPSISIVSIKDGKQVQVDNQMLYGNGSVYAPVTFSKKADRLFACLAKNVAGKTRMTAEMFLHGLSGNQQTKPLPSGVIAAIAVSLVFFVIIILVIAIWYKRRLEKKYAPYLKPNRYFQLDPDRTLFEQSGELPYDTDWEFPRDRLNFLKMIGSGAFGEVWLAEAEGILTLEPRDKTSNAAKRRSKIRRSQRYTHLSGREKKKKALPESAREKTLVAVKTLKGDASDTEYKDLASELKILIHIGENKQIVNLLGSCTRGGKLCVVLEYCPHGSLLNFLRERRTSFEPVWSKNEPDMSNEVTNIDLTMIAYQIAKGLDFLASKKCVHRDVAARNVLIGVDYIVKVADFGLARDIYKDEFYMKSTSGLLPVKWMAPESLFDKIYTSQSDVWSYGIVLWEIFTLGGSPYPGLPTEDLFSFLDQGRRMEQPDSCPHEFYAIMTDCWKRNPDERPFFSQLVHRTEQIITDRSGQDNPYLHFDEFDAPTIPSGNSDYLEPIITRTQPRGSSVARGSNISNGMGSTKGTEAEDAPDYLNDTSVKMSLLHDYDDDAHNYANTMNTDGLNEFAV